MGRFGQRLSLMSQAARSAMQSKGLKRFDTCSCHPRSWGPQEEAPSREASP